MANDNHASYAKVGFTLVLGLAAIVGALIYFGGVGDSRNEYLCETYYDHPVSGLSVGSEVNFRGVKIGQVKEISFVAAEYDDYAESDAQIIVIRLALDRHLCHLETEDSAAAEAMLAHLIGKGLRATVSSSGITGLSKLELNLPRIGTTAPPAMQLSWRPALPWIPPEPSMLESFSDSVTDLMNRFKGVDFTAAWSNLTTITESASSVAANANTLLDSQKENIDEILSNLRAASGSLKELAEELKANPSLLLRSSDAAPLDETCE